ncbi:hypothetical protein DAPPUDRAFT_233122 [Daphnia pulex]|uniref:Uncharacterized protein n=1 Tax=Daphnia pulex TaxID=6669 RepID=E9FT93_DAPPU|nr:hypothetical protein DAPPUDRAFT_233122 [Daphnia pulex]|eukprot:EFX89688.1 hypothetical protein DAPPUDRAFT_233122 [Daphnia pulex]
MLSGVKLLPGNLLLLPAPISSHPPRQRECSVCGTENAVSTVWLYLDVKLLGSAAAPVENPCIPNQYYIVITIVLAIFRQRFIASFRPTLIVGKSLCYKDAPRSLDVSSEDPKLPFSEHFTEIQMEIEFTYPV